MANDGAALAADPECWANGGHLVAGRGALTLGCLLLGVTATLLAAEALGVWLATVPSGGRWLLDIALDGSLLTIALAVLALLPALVLLVLRHTRLYGLALLAWVPIHLGLFMTVGPKIHDWWMSRVRDRLESSQDLIAAIGTFSSRHGRPPQQLAELVPECLPAVPGTGMGGYPRYSYSVDPAVGWRLSIHAGAGIADYGYLEFNPKREYPQGATAMGEWAYLNFD